MDTSWNALAREARDVTTSACRELGIDKAIFTGVITTTTLHEHADHEQSSGEGSADAPHRSRL